MSSHDAPGRRRQQARKRRTRTLGARLGALASLLVVAAVVVVAVLKTTSGSNASSAKHGSGASTKASHTSSHGSASSTRPGTAAVPVLIYNVINTAPASTSLSPSLYVPADEFTSQMEALKSGGWHAVTLDQLQAYWSHGTSLGPGKPIVISFDGGYASQYTTALPVLKRLGWVGVENLELNGLSPSDGGLNEQQVRGLVSAGWELDTQGIAGTDLTTLTPDEARTQVTEARQTLRSRYGVPGNWFSYPMGRYTPTVTAAVQAAGFVGATTVVPGWASPAQDRFRLPRLQVPPGTSSTQLLAQIDSAKSSAPPPSSSSGSSSA
jgi:peptidoglycan/xylan/chitin deacetylase (PgdA/CDA1 family)